MDLIQQLLSMIDKDLLNELHNLLDYFYKRFLILILIYLLILKAKAIIYLLIKAILSSIYASSESWGLRTH